MRERKLGEPNAVDGDAGVVYRLSTTLTGAWTDGGWPDTGAAVSGFLGFRPVNIDRAHHMASRYVTTTVTTQPTDTRSVVANLTGAAASIPRVSARSDDTFSNAQSAPVSAAPTSPTQSQEVAFISGVDTTGKVVATSFKTWNGDTPATYATYGDATKWGTSRVAGTAGGTLLYYFDPASNWTTAEQTALRSGLTLWSAVANISFALTTVASKANLTFKRGSDGGADEDAPSSGYAAVGSTRLASQGRGVFISIDTSVYGWQQLGSFSYAGGYAVDTVVHEEGHFLGLGHAGPYNGSVVGSQQYSAYDSRLWSLMSYIEPSETDTTYYSQYPVTGTAWNGDPTTWMPLDILAAQQLYGVAVTTPLSGGQTFGFNTNITGDLQPFFDFTTNNTPIITLWDKGTGNTIDLSGYSTSSTINLNPGSYSSFDGMTNNMAIAFGTAIDNAVGGAGNDIFTVNGDADTIYGGDGTNEVVFSGPAAAYTETRSGSMVTVTWTATGAVDTLSDIQGLQFSDQFLSTSDIACFLEGTRLRVGASERAVETIRAGDRVATLVDGRAVMKPVVWIGRRSIDVATMRDPEEGFPVRIRARAFGRHRPLRDLLVTQDHCLFVNGGLIPARMLVNGRSITIDRGIGVYNYYHVELAEHGLLLAEGLATESYLDTGHRCGFEASSGDVLDCSTKTWATHAVAPLTVDRATVEPAWRMLNDRACRLGFAATARAARLTDDPALRLATESGTEIWPLRRRGNRYIFVVPARAGGLRLRSRTARPSDTIGPFVDDRRALGVLVGEVAVWRRARRLVTNCHLTADELGGWFPRDDARCRWTAGEAELPDCPGREAAAVEIELVDAGPYVDGGSPGASRLRERRDQFCAGVVGMAQFARPVATQS